MLTYGETFSFGDRPTVKESQYFPSVYRLTNMTFNRKV